MLPYFLIPRFCCERELVVARTKTLLLRRRKGEGEGEEVAFALQKSVESFGAK